MSKTKTKQRLFVVDGNNILRKAFYGMKPLHDPKGRQTHAIKGLMNRINECTSRYSADAVAVAFDSPGPNHRHEMYPDYKGTRKEGRSYQEQRTPHLSEEDFARQARIARRLVKALGYRILYRHGVEADDLMGSALVRWSDLGGHAVGLTGDKDFFQLVSPTIHILNANDNELYDARRVRAKFGGLRPHQIAEYLALMGDHVDNIPGVKGIGPVTATALLNTYGDLATVRANKRKLSKSVLNAFRACGAKRLKLWVDLTTIQTDLLDDRDRSWFMRREADEEAARIMKQLGFKHEQQRSLGRLWGRG